MKIIRMHAEHANILAQMHAKCFEHPWSEQSFNALMQNRTNRVLVLADESNEDLVPLGFVMYQIVDNEAEMVTICTLPKYRGKGVGSKLIDAIDAKKIFLEVDETNIPAVSLYKKKGFQIDKVREHYYENGNNALNMSKLIEKRDF